ncbi:hypothetical protein BS78_07G228800 [Paspalum vaginatum]|nr:hypothetical protein BS78_07G228800 [Paspalum vaginatum]
MSLVVAAPMAAAVDLAQPQQQEEEDKAKQQQQKQGRDDEDDDISSRFGLLMKGVRHLSDSGITRLPDRYILPAPDRPGAAAVWSSSPPPPRPISTGTGRVKLPVVDLACLRDPSQRAAVLGTLDAACRDYGFFQVVNHGVGRDVTGGMLDVARRFFELPLSERSRYMSADVRAKVRYGTSFNQAKDAVLCWRDFLKLVCQPLQEVAPCWPREPAELRDVASAYAAATHGVFLELMDAALEALLGGAAVPAMRTMMGELAAPGGSSQMMTLNCYPACPQPELTLGMPPHSDYGLLTLVLQDHVEGLQVMTQDGRWLTVDPIPGAFVVNVGDHLECRSTATGGTRACCTGCASTPRAPASPSRPSTACRRSGWSGRRRS